MWIVEYDFWWTTFGRLSVDLGINYPNEQIHNFRTNRYVVLRITRREPNAFRILATQSFASIPETIAPPRIFSFPSTWSTHDKHPELLTKSTENHTSTNQIHQKPDRWRLTNFTIRRRSQTYPRPINPSPFMNLPRIQQIGTNGFSNRCRAMFQRHYWTAPFFVNQTANAFLSTKKNAQRWFSLTVRPQP